MTVPHITMPRTTMPCIQGYVAGGYKACGVACTAAAEFAGRVCGPSSRLAGYAGGLLCNTSSLPAVSGLRSGLLRLRRFWQVAGRQVA